MSTAKKKPEVIDAHMEKSLAILQRSVGSLQYWMECVKLTTVEDVQQCSAARQHASSTYDAAETDRKSFTDPLNKVVKSINARYKLVTGPAIEVKDRCSTLLLDYKQEEQKRALAKAEKEAKKAEKQGAPELAEDIRQAALDKPVNLGPGVAGTRKVYRVEIEDPTKISLEIWMLAQEEVVKKMSARARVDKEAFNVTGFRLVVEEIVQGAGGAE